MEAVGEKVLTCITVVIVILTIIGFAICVLMANNGSMSDYTAMVAGGLLSTIMMFTIVIYAAILMNRDDSPSEAYARFVEEKEGKE